MKRLYHKEVYWCKNFDSLAKKLFNNNYSVHLFEHLLFDSKQYRMTIRELDGIIEDIMNNKCRYYLYEVETIGKDNLIKAVVRTKYDMYNDISIVFFKRPDGKLQVNTAWLNNKNDKHNTLNKNKYFSKK